MRISTSATSCAHKFYFHAARFFSSVKSQKVNEAIIQHSRNFLFRSISNQFEQLNPIKPFSGPCTFTHTKKKRNHSEGNNSTPDESQNKIQFPAQHGFLSRLISFFLTGASNDKFQHPKGTKEPNKRNR